MDIDSVDSPSPPHPLRRFSKASQAVHATHALDEVLTRVITELHSALDSEAASVALLDGSSGKMILHAAGPVAERISGLRLPLERGIIGWVITSGRSAVVNDVSLDDRFWAEVDGYSGFETRSVLCAPLVSGNQVIGALEVLNKRNSSFGADDLHFLEAFGAVAASAIENAQSFRTEQQRRREMEALRSAWEALTTPRSLEELLEVILDQLQKLIEYRSASILLITEDGGLELGTSRGFDDLDEAARAVRTLGVDTKVRTMLETGKPMLIADTRTDTRWHHLPGFSYIRSWIGAPLLIKGHLIGTLNVDHDQPGYYTAEDVQLVTNFAHQAAIAIENGRLYAATHEATVQLAENARRMVSLYEASRALLGGLKLDQDALYELLERISDLIGARYGVLNILAQNGESPLFIIAGPSDSDIANLDRDVLQHSILGMLSKDREVVRSADLRRTTGTRPVLPPAVLDDFIGIAIHARDRLLGQILFADKQGPRYFNQDDEALVLALAANLAGAIDNSSLYGKTQQQIHELTALFEISQTVMRAREINQVYSRLASQVGRLLDAERCAFFIYSDGVLQCQAPGYGLDPDIIPLLRFEIGEEDPLYALINASGPLISNVVPEDPDLADHMALLAELGIHRLISCPIPIDDKQLGLVLAANKQGGEEFSEQDRHLVSIMAHQVSNAIQRSLAYSRRREDARIQSALLQVSQAISSLTDLDELLQAVAEITHKLVGCDHCLIAPWEERETAFVPRAQSGISPGLDQTLPRMQLRPATAAVIASATETREPVLLTLDEAREIMPVWPHDQLGVQNILIVPLVTQEQVVGLVVLSYRQQHPLPGKRDITLVTGIARQAAIAIENANLYRDLQLHAEQLERAYRDLKELDERKTQIVQNVSHELRTPFTLIKGYLELLREEELGALNERQKQGLATIAEKTDALARLILDIITAQSFDAASLELHEFDLSIVCNAVLEKLRPDVSPVQLLCDVPPDTTFVRADPYMLERVFDLLLDNAVKFSPDGGTITLRARPEGEMIYIEVEDQGIGIPAEALSHVFDAFYQVDGSTTRRFGGAGLGLSIVKQIVTAHGGSVGVHSIRGRGTAFYFTLPNASPSRTT
jgi:GAF domain-containing protein